MSAQPNAVEARDLSSAPKGLCTAFQALAFAFVGVVNTAVDVVAFMALTWAGLHPLVANVISFSLGAINSLVLNKNLTFRDSGVRFSRKLILTFTLATLLSLAVSQASLYGLLQAGLPELGAKFASVVFTFAVSFLFNKYLTFRP